MPYNSKKEFPINGLEEDCTSKYLRSLYCFVKNTRGIKRFVKKSMNRRFRKRAKTQLREVVVGDLS